MKTVSLELSKQLKETGYQQISEFYWIQDIDETWVRTRLTIIKERIASPTADEILDQLPDLITKDGREYELEIGKGKIKWGVVYNWEKYDEQRYLLHATGNCLADAAAKMWLYLKKEGLLNEVLRIEESNGE